ncbi:MAG TPA: hypothetical protein VIT67_14650 [Povalibacter sp.]
MKGPISVVTGMGLSLCLAASAAPLSQRSSAAAPLIVHEWGTFTSFQDRKGVSVAGINIDDEPVPEFVHRLPGLEIYTNHALLLPKGVAACHEDVTLRLETPVVYFYPGNGFSSDQTFSVTATFAAGWLTEFYPAAASVAPGFPTKLDSATRSSLTWNDLSVGTSNDGLTPTTDPVWLAPRKVASAIVSTPQRTQVEKYLFYRGVAHLDAPLVVQQADNTVMLSLRDGATLEDFPQTWLVRVGRDGRVWHHAVKAADVKNGSASVSLTGAAPQATGLSALRSTLLQGLVKAGLYEDEARAMLDTWQQSYFASEGLRVFFLLPQSWTDARLPLSISVRADTARVMMGRIELISGEQQAALAALYALPDSAINVDLPYTVFMKGSEALSEPELQARWTQLMKIYGDRPSLSDTYHAVGQKVPEAVKLYDSLGRFRDPLLGHEYASTSDPALRKRIGNIIQQFSSCNALKQGS